MTATESGARRGALPLGMRVLLALGFVLAVSATILVAFVTDTHWLRLAGLLGVWAALIAAIGLARSRREVRSANVRTDESRLTYQLELQREISARREFEIGVVAGAREQAEQLHRAELDGLRQQLDRLNSTLSGLLGGELFVERLTLSTESTRIRQVGEGPRGAAVRLQQLDGESVEAEPARLPNALVVEPAAGRTEPAVAPVGESAATTGPSAPEHAPAGAETEPGSQNEFQTGTGADRLSPRSGHSSGIAVSELLAAYGTGTVSSSRRRRAED